MKRLVNVETVLASTNWVLARMWTLTALTVGLVLFFGVDKIRLLWWDAPALQLWDNDPFRVVGLHVYRVMLLFSCLWGIASLLPHAERRETWTKFRLVGPGAAAVLSLPASLMNVVVQRVLAAAQLGRTGDARSYVGIAVAAAALVFIAWSDGGYRAAGGLALATGVWLFLSDPLDGSELIPENRLAATMVGGRGLLMVAISGLFGIALWAVIQRPGNLLTHRLFTIWACAQFILGWLCLAAYVDAITHRTPARFALGWLVLAAVVLLESHTLVLGDAPCEVDRDARDCHTPDGECFWMDEALARVDGMADPEGPVLVVAASGGGSRAALHATLVFEALERTPAHGPIGAWDRVSETNLADQVLFISSVSGGSVASAHYVSQPQSIPQWCDAPMAEGVVPPECSLRNTIDAELEYELHREHNRLCAAQNNRETWGLLCDDANPEGFQTENHWPTRSRRFDDLSMDFTAALVKGVLLPGTERGESMSRFWEERFDWSRRPGDPLLLVNVTEVYQGTRFVSGHPPLPPKLLADDDFGEATSISSLGEVCLTVEESVRLSANFPWGFALPRLEDETGAVLPMLDGGVLDNTGLDTLAVLFERLLYLADHATGKDHPGLHHRARSLLNAVAPRGVVVLEIDSGAKPEPPGLLTETLAELLMPVHSLNTSAYARAVSASEANIARIDAVLETWTQRMVATGTLFWPDEESQDAECGLAEGDTPTNVDVVGSRVEHVVYALDTESIITAWALTPEQKAQIAARFLNEDSTQRLELKDAYEDMRGDSLLLRMTANAALDRPALADLMETLAWDRRALHGLKEEVLGHQTRQRQQGRMGLDLDARYMRSDHGWSYLGTAYDGEWASSAMRFGGDYRGFREAPLPFPLDITEPVFVRNTAPNLNTQGWAFPAGVVDPGVKVCVVEVCSISYFGSGDCHADPEVEPVPELVFGRLESCPTDE